MISSFKSVVLISTLFLLVTASLGKLSSQSLASETVTSDLIFLKEQILKYNPGVEQYNPNFRQQADSLIGNIDGAYNRYQSFSQISKLCALANEGHFELGSWEDTIHTGIVNDLESFLPLSVLICEQKIYVDRDFSNNNPFTRGDRILNINGRSDQEILKDLLACTPTDGYITTYGLQKIESNFPWFYYFYIEQTPQFEIDFEPLGSDTVMSSVVQALTNSERKINAYKQKPREPAKESSLDDFFTLTHTEGYAVLTLKSFDYRLVEKFNIKAKDFYSQLFSEIKDSGHSILIVDIRGNTGGRNAFGEELVPFIMNNNADIPFLMRSTSWSGKITTDKTPKPHKNRFKGDIHVLIDGYSFSNGGVIARYLKEFTNARFYGEEGGMRYEGFVAGSKQYVTLPNTQIRIGIPRYNKVFPPSKKQKTTNRGLIPDVAVATAIEDRILDHDPVMDAVLRKIQR